jgi:hypothetical protein
MAEPPLVLTDAPDERDIKRLGYRPLAVLIKDGFGHTVAGISGCSAGGGMLFLGFIFPAYAMRRSGLAGRMLAMAEEEGRRRGCKSAVLSTIGIDKVPDFFSEQGWRVFGEIPRGPPNPPGTREFFMTKDL